MELQSLASLVNRQAADLAVYADFLVGALDGALPAEQLTVKRHASLADRVRGRPARVVEVSVRLGEQTYVLQRLNPTAAVQSLVCHEVGGIVLSRKPVALAEWSTALAGSLQNLAAENVATAAALRRMTGFDV